MGHTVVIRCIILLSVTTIGMFAGQAAFAYVQAANPSPQPKPVQDTRATSPVSQLATAPTSVEVLGPAEGSRRQVTFRVPGVTETLEIALPDSNTTARDDGAEGDAKSKDGLFTITIDAATAENLIALQRATQEEGALVIDGRALNKSGSLASTSACPPRFVPAPGLSKAEQIRLGKQSLIIRDLSVVNSTEAQTGVWSFGHLITQMVNEPVTGINPSVFTEKWLNHWLTDQTVSVNSVNPQVVPARTEMAAKVITPWRTASGGGQLDLSKAPVRLLAIVFRLDLRNNLLLNPSRRIGGGGAGELRFVYGVLDETGGKQLFTVILEYQVKRKNFLDVLAWAHRVHGLYANFPNMNTPAYRTALAKLTNEVTASNSDSEQVPNANSISQIRTNEIFLTAPWELREFRLADTGYLQQVTVKQTPDDRYNNQQRVTDFIISRKADLLCRKHVIPTEFQGNAFLAASSLSPTTMPGVGELFWNSPGLSGDQLEARHFLSLASCNACHAKETNTNFLHIVPRDASQEAQLSGFLAGDMNFDPISVVDPAGQGITRKFNDLKARIDDLRALVRFGWAYEFTRSPLQMAH